jgi:[ribosomal protein S5]-alanine N-acetyltransferase
MIMLTTERLIIRDHVLSDLESHHLLMSNDTNMLYLQDIRTRSLEDSEQNLMLAIDEITNPNRKFYFFRIENKLKQHIGEIGYTVLETTPVGKIVEVGYFLHSGFWGNGYATEALKAVMRYAFMENGVFRITTGCCKDNLGSEKVMIKCGMTKEGEHKQCQWQEGKMRDRVSYRMLKDEWLVQGLQNL